jgi:hypothetical protein
VGTIGIGFTPSRLLVQTMQAVGYKTFILMLFVPNRAFGFVHHFISADGVVFTQAQEIVEK